MIAQQIKKILLQFSASKVQHESLVAYDFKMTDKKSALMQMCFSALANWSLIIIFALLYINPLRYQFSIHSFFEADSRLVFWAYSENFLWGFLIFTVLASLVNIEILWLSILAWLISNGEIHVLISVGGVTGVFFASARRNLKLMTFMQSKIKKVWMYFSLAQIAAVFTSAILNYFIYVNLKNFGYFSTTMTINRFEFFIFAVALHNFIQFVVLSLWGHFYARYTTEPSDWIISYSSAEILNKLSLSRKFKFELKDFCQQKLNEKMIAPFVEGLPNRLLKMSEAETAHLKIALQSLS